jgi:quinol monooxygenase YgiN
VTAAGAAVRNDSGVTEHVVVVGRIHSLLGRRDELLELMLDTQIRVREEPGCVSFDFSEIVGERGDFVVVHEWRDEAALEAHYRSAPFLAYQEAVGDLLARPSELRVHRVRETLQPAEGEPMDPRRAD